jgi:hypothetical protein
MDHVNVTDIADVGTTAATEARKLQLRGTHKESSPRHPLSDDAQSLSVLVSYTINEFAVASALGSISMNISDTLVKNVNDGTFNSWLMAFGQESEVTVLSAGDVFSLPNSVSFGTVVPTAVPTAAPTAKPTFLMGISNASHSTSVTAIIAIVVVMGVIILAAITYMITRCLFFWRTQPAWANDIVVVDPSAPPEEPDM